MNPVACALSRMKPRLPSRPRTAARAASLFGAGLAGFASDLVSVFVSLLVSVLVSVFVSVLGESDFDSLLSAPRLSVLYQPDPLKRSAGALKRRRGRLPQFGHFSAAW